MFKYSWILFVYIATLCVAEAASGQSFQLAAQRGPYYVGEPVVVQVIAEEFSSGIQPVCRLKESSASSLTVEGPQVSQSVSSYMQIINGRMSRRESANYRFNFVVTALEEGDFTIGPFEVEFDGQTRIVEGTTLRFGRLENDPDMQISISVPQSSFYLGQRIPVTIRWAFAGELQAVQYAFSNLQIRSPLFDQFTFEPEQPSSRTRLAIATAKGVVEIDATVTEERENGKNFIVVTGRRTLIPDVVGNFDSIPVTCRTKKVTSWRSDLFGDLRPGGTAPSLAAGEPLRFSVRPLPTEGRRESFAGAVGAGFSLDVTANRTVVRVGDPISLNISVRGEGNLENVSLPSLSADNGLAKDKFQFPAESPPGNFDGATKQFKVNVRVTDENVTQIPALAFSWFDPSREEYVTTRSKPIALQVMPAQVVSAEDVIAAPSSADSSMRGSEDVNRSEAGSIPSNSVAELSLEGANLAIETDATKLLTRDRGSLMGMATVLGPYVVGGVAILAAVLIRRRADVDPDVIVRQKQLKQWRQQLADASRRPPRDAGQQVAAALRNVLAVCDPADRSPVEELIKECETLVYAPDASGLRVSVDSLVRRGLSVFDAMAKA